MLDWLPWRRPARREHRSSYSSLVLAGLEAEAAGTGRLAAWEKSAAAEIAAGWWSRALALAEVSPANTRTACLTPLQLATIGRRLALSGQFVARLAVDARGVDLVEAWSWDVTGRRDPSTWRYRLTEAGPSVTESRHVPAAGVMHVRYAWRPSTPWIGLSPAAAAVNGAGIVGGIDRQLSGEAAGPSGYVMPAPDVGGDESDDGDDPMVTMRGELRDLAGGLTLAPTMAAGHGAGPGAAPRDDYRARRFGMDPPERMVELRRQVLGDALHAYGIPPVVGDERASAQAFREARRVFLSETMPAIGNLLASQAAGPLGVPDLAFTFPAAGDIATRARAINSLVQAGATFADARSIVGL